MTALTVNTQHFVDGWDEEVKEEACLLAHLDVALDRLAQTEAFDFSVDENGQPLNDETKRYQRAVNTSIEWPLESTDRTKALYLPLLLPSADELDVLVDDGHFSTVEGKTVDMLNRVLRQNKASSTAHPAPEAHA